ncbi:DUF5131 family protein [Azospirillum sp. TSA6c]|uniref:DUF5131 family protein n=1 Tax=Azospirillum sp. TSA6c TaxID=709813 RepID=UPI001304F37E|nr:DUF5131 family protein [Azospirillum sp. TSA6c]
MADLSPHAWVHWDLDDDLATPLNRQAPTVFSVGADLFAMPVRNPAGHQAQVFGVMAVAGAVGKFQGPQDGFTQRGSWTASDSKEIPIRWPNYLSGPHVFMVETRHLLAARRVMAASNIGPGLHSEVVRTAYQWAHDRVNAGDISDRIERGDLWPLPNVWIGTTARMQSEVDHAGHLAQVSTAHRFLRLRLLDEVSLRDLFGLYEPEAGVFALKVGSRWEGSPDWVIVSAPDGPSPQASWVETIIAQCRGAGVPVWVDADVGIFLPETQRVQELPQVELPTDAMGSPETDAPDPSYPASGAPPAVSYTLADVDAALRVILGHRIFDALRQSPTWSRPQMMKEVAVECFTRQRPEDLHTAVLRAAIQHLDKTGAIMPEDAPSRPAEREYPPATPMDLLNMAHWVKKNLHCYRPDTAENADAIHRPLAALLESAAAQLSGRLHPDQDCTLPGTWFRDGNDQWQRIPRPWRNDCDV